MFPSVACSSYFGYFVQFSRCVLVSKTRSKHSLFCKCLHPSLEKMVGPSGLEPPTSRLSVVCSNQLSYWPIGGDERNRTADPLLARQVLSQLSYTPKLGLKVVLSDSFMLSVFAPAFPSFSFENESQLSYTPIFNCWCLARSEGKFLQN